MKDMKRGEFREKMLTVLDECPDEVLAGMEGLIDEIEMAAKDIGTLMDIESIHDLDKIEDAYRAADTLADYLY